MANREFLLKAQTQKIVNGKPKFDVRGWWASEKLDGVRTWWDGGISRGLLKSQVPWANNKSKDQRFVTTPKATGLWSSYGNPIYAPDWWLDELPKISLDGELFIGRRMFQRTTSVVSKLQPNDDDWQFVSLNVFDSPPYPAVFANGKINNIHFQKEMDIDDCMLFVRNNIPDYRPKFYTLAQAYNMLRGYDENRTWKVVPQTLVESQEQIEAFINFVADLQGEGVMFRKPGSYWEPKRSHTIVKQKPFEDAEGTVTGYTWGKETDKGSKFLGLMGNLVLNYNGKRLELSGFNDSERVMTMIHPDGNPDEGKEFAGQEISKHWMNQRFPIGTLVTFRYREHSDDGIPKEARFDRVRFGHA